MSLIPNHRVVRHIIIIIIHFVRAIPWWAYTFFYLFISAFTYIFFVGCFFITCLSHVVPNFVAHVFDYYLPQISLPSSMSSLAATAAPLLSSSTPKVMNFIFGYIFFAFHFPVFFSPRFVACYLRSADTILNNKCDFTSPIHFIIHDVVWFSNPTEEEEEKASQAGAAAAVAPASACLCLGTFFQGGA